jgi:histidinol-phosphate aminotransferase
MPHIRPEFLKLRGYARPQGEATGTGMARLHLNEPPRDWPDSAKQALLARLEALPFQHYPERQGELTARLERALGAPEGGVLLGPSSGALLDLVALAGLAPGEAVAFPDPGFGLYPVLAARNSARAVRVPIGDGFPLEPWLRLLEQEPPRQLWLNLPNNPTGAWLSPEQLEPLLAAAAALPDPPLVVLDEAYAEFAPRTHRLAVDRYPNLVLLRTFSKALASAGWRLGYLLGAPELLAPLATLQLPYSVPAPALEALDVALDFQAALLQPVREVPERRERLAEALEGRVAVASAANFLFLRPDPAPALREAGLQARALPELDAGRLTVGTEEEARRAAEALGVPLAEPRERARRRLLALDMDGVLIDGDPGFMAAVAKAVAELAPGIDWMDAHYLGFKAVGGFNNDYRLCAAAVALAERGELDRVWSAAPAGFPDLEARIAELEPMCAEAVVRHYKSVPPPDLPLVTEAELDALEGWDKAILTGRNYEEMAWGLDCLGFRLPGVGDAAPHLRKPKPGGLLQLADAYQAEEIVFVGDTRDDGWALRSAREARPDLVWTFAAVGPQRDAIARAEDLRAPSLRALLEQLKGARP